MINDNYLEQKKQECIESLEASAIWSSPRDEVEAYFPEETKSDIPEEGCWIMVISPPFTEYTVKKFSIWYAMNDNGKAHPSYPMFVQRYAKIKTPNGDLRLFPREYNKININDYIELIDGEHCVLHFMVKNAVMEKAVEEKMFYLRSRGLSKQEAYRFVLGDIKDPNLCYLEFHQAYIDMFTR